MLSDRQPFGATEMNLFPWPRTVTVTTADVVPVAPRVVTGRVERHTFIADDVEAREFPDRVTIRCVRPLQTHTVENAPAVAHPATGVGRGFELRCGFAGEYPRRGDEISDADGATWLVTTVRVDPDTARFVVETTRAPE